MLQSSRLLGLSLLAALSSLLYINFYPLLNKYGGRLNIKDYTYLTTHLSHGPSNNNKCWTFPEGKACEDIRIHHESGTAFLACGYPETRTVFYPPLGTYDTKGARSYREYFLKYDIENNKTSALDTVGWDGDLVLHGIDLYLDFKDSKTLYLFAVNHARKGESILVFKHSIESNSLNFIKEYQHPLIKTPNAVAATGLNSFFISNDHYSYPSHYFGLLRYFEHTFGPFSWASSVVHCSVAISGDLDCKIVSPAKSHPAANGLLLLDGGKTLMVNEIVEATTSIYDVDHVSKMLSLRKKVKLGAPADNLSIIPGSGDVAVCVFPDATKLRARLSGNNPLNSSMIAPAAVLRLKQKDDYEPEVMYWDDGSLITVLTGAAVDPKRKKMIAGGVVERHFIVCDLDGVVF
ncbi:calcium-dependent phosphotriesterase [Tothia fuscella]|uniref:Calcium-dependent phosphotriesterase n=1 Tax=Tothia fuscella TaxID=1048955 RepID=A0A9P4NQ33_9PEZI|nr:calcium-dependent phosphotriesterase [Tothia fuscella]